MNVIATLFEGHYHHGAAALLNSLAAAGFRGAFVAGYRGAAPAWAASVTERLRDSGIELSLEALDTPRHLTNYKPDFLRTVAQRPGVERIYYFDPDIVLYCPFDFLSDWVDGGIAVCEDVNNYRLHDHHPLVAAWRRWLDARGMAYRSHPGRFVNGGFLGLARRDFGFLDIWTDVMDRLEADGIDLGAFMPYPRTHPFHSTDQDALNVALMLTPAPVATIGPEAMDFIPGGYVMSHAIGAPKPWAKSFWRSALAGRPPTLADSRFFAFAGSGVASMSAAELARRKADLKLGKLIARFVRR